MYIASFPPLWSCCVCDKRAAYDRTVGGQSEEGGADRATHSSRLQTQSSSQCFRGNLLWGTDQLWEAAGAHLYISVPQFCRSPPRKMSEVNMAKRKEKCENCTKQVIFWIFITALSGRLSSSCWIWKTLSCCQWIQLLLSNTVQQESCVGWWWCQLTPGKRWSQRTGNFCLLTSLIYCQLICQTKCSSGCFIKGALSLVSE